MSYLISASPPRRVWAICGYIVTLTILEHANPVPLFVSPVIRAIVYSLTRQSILFQSCIKLGACTLSVPTPEKRVLRRHEPGYGVLVLWYLPTQDLTRCIRVNSTLCSHASFAHLQDDAGQGQRPAQL